MWPPHLGADGIRRETLASPRHGDGTHKRLATGGNEHLFVFLSCDLWAIHFSRLRRRLLCLCLWAGFNLSCRSEIRFPPPQILTYASSRGTIDSLHFFHCSIYQNYNIQYYSNIEDPGLEICEVNSGYFKLSDYHHHYKMFGLLNLGSFREMGI